MERKINIKRPSSNSNITICDNFIVKEKDRIGTMEYIKSDIIRVIWNNSISEFKEVELIKINDNYAYQINTCSKLCRMRIESSANTLKCDTFKLINLHIAKNMSTSILCLFSEIETGYKAAWGYKTLDHTYRIDIREVKKYDEYEKFIVFRDPLERAISTMNMFFENREKMYFFNNLEKKDYIKNMIDLMEIHNMNIPEMYYLADQHLSSQFKNIQPAFEENYTINTVVLMENVTDFIYNRTGRKLEIKNKTEKVIDKVDLTDEQILKIKDIYKEDYDLLEMFKGIIWKNEKNV